MAGLTDIGWMVIPLPVTTLDCDFDGDGACDATDLNLLYENFGTTTAGFDLNGDGNVTGGDIAAWLAAASSPDNPFNTDGNTFVLGDVDLNGAVNSIDLGLLLNNFLDSSGLLYEAGNLNDDAIVDSIDLGLLLNIFLFTSQNSAAVSAVPEPDMAAILLPLLLSVLAARTQSSRIYRRTA